MFLIVDVKYPYVTSDFTCYGRSGSDNGNGGVDGCYTFLQDMGEKQSA